MEDQTKVIITTSNQVQNLFKKIDSVSNQLSNLRDNFKPKEPIELITRNEVSKMFKIDLSTVHNWTKKGKIIGYSIPGSSRIYYKRSELEKLLIQINK